MCLGVIGILWMQLKYTMQPVSVKVTHIYKDGNQAADNLANWSIIHRSNRVFFSSTDLPATARRAVKLDRLNIPYI